MSKPILFRCECESGTCTGAENSYDFVRLEYPQDDLPFIQDSKSIVVTLTTIQLYYTYPLTTPLTFSHSSEVGFTRIDLINLVAADYQCIFNQHTDKLTCDEGHLKSIVLTSICHIKDNTYRVNVDV